MPSVYQEIIDCYKETGSIRDTVECVGVSKVKVQRVLITEGLWSSKSSVQIGQYYKAGIATDEIAKRLRMSVKNVQAYIPYSRGEYGALSTGDSRRCKKYRERMAALNEFHQNRSEHVLGKVIDLFQGYPFHTDEGIRFTYIVRNGEMVISQKDIEEAINIEDISRFIICRHGSDHIKNNPHMQTIFSKWGLQ